MESNKLKIALVCPLTGMYSGAHEYAVQLKVCLEKIGHKVDIFSIKGTGKCPIKNTKIIEINRFRDTSNQLDEYDIIHLTSVSENTKKDPKFLSVCKKFNYFITIHSCEHDVSLINNWKEIAKNAKATIFTSESNRKYYIDTYPDIFNIDNTVCIDMPFYPNIYKNKSREKLAVSTSRFISYKKIFDFFKSGENLDSINFVHMSMITTNGKSFYGMAGKTYFEKINSYIQNKQNMKMIDYSKMKEESRDIKNSYLRKSKYLIDLSSFEIDTDRVQYTTLEAMEHGVVPIFHKKFFGNKLVNNRNGISCENSNDVENAIKFLEENPNCYNMIVDNNYKFLKEIYPNGEKYIQFYLKLLKN